MYHVKHIFHFIFIGLPFSDHTVKVFEVLTCEIEANKTFLFHISQDDNTCTLLTLNQGSFTFASAR